MSSNLLTPIGNFLECWSISRKYLSISVKFCRIKDLSSKKFGKIQLILRRSFGKFLPLNFRENCKKFEKNIVLTNSERILQENFDSIVLLQIGFILNKFSLEVILLFSVLNFRN